MAFYVAVLKLTEPVYGLYRNGLVRYDIRPNAHRTQRMYASHMAHFVTKEIIYKLIVESTSCNDFISNLLSKKKTIRLLQMVKASEIFLIN